MPTLLGDIILPERTRTEAQSGVVADRMRRAGVAPLAAEFMEVQAEIDEVTSFAHGLWERRVLDDEMPTKVIDVSRVWNVTF